MLNRHFPPAAHIGTYIFFLLVQNLLMCVNGSNSSFCCVSRCLWKAAVIIVLSHPAVPTSTLRSALKRIWMGATSRERLCPIAQLVLRWLGTGSRAALGCWCVSATEQHVLLKWSWAEAKQLLGRGRQLAALCTHPTDAAKAISVPWNPVLVYAPQSLFSLTFYTKQNYLFWGTRIYLNYN